MKPPLWRSAFLAALEEEGGNITMAADRAGCHRTQVYRRMRIDPYFNVEVEKVFARIEESIRSTVIGNRKSA